MTENTEVYHGQYFQSYREMPCLLGGWQSVRSSFCVLKDFPPSLSWEQVGKGGKSVHPHNVLIELARETMRWSSFPLPPCHGF